MQKIIRLSENQLHNLIMESVYSLLKEKEEYKSRNKWYNQYVRARGMWNDDIKNGDKPYFPNADEETKKNSKPSIVKKDYFKRAKKEYQNLKNKN